ncbi:putative helicase [Escovopsis weberi]|uniref:Putative helicase n=1 Tax=Escovopsis weberi TaxID=150374 RepID=A0A0M8MZY1_ESCWE|nr:putative helicase [Escovopsis weberi]
MFRTGYLRVVVATGTLALGINMPCKTVVFHGDSIFLTAQGYQQASGRAGRRGFDLLGNVVFHGIPRDRVFEIISARIPGLTGQFPISTTLVLRLLTLLHGSENSTFATTMVQSLLSQTRLYLGGPEAALSVKHHLRFSIEYLRRHRLLRSDGTPINFAGLVGHLYFTENNVFAFHSLLKGGYFHQICAQLDRNPERVLLQMVLVLCHIFNRVPILRRQILAEKSHRSPSMIFLPRLPQRAETLLIEHNEETLSIFQDYVQSYISDSLADIRDRTLPYTRTMVGQEEPSGGGLCSETSHVVRSPFVALSGLKDDFKSIHELCETVRSDVFLEESAIPYIPVWPHDSQVELNAYIYDFWKHGSMEVLVRDNGIKRGDVWFRLQDFSRTLSTIVTSIATLMGGDQAGVDATNDGSDCEFNPEEDGQARFLNPGPQQASKPKAKTPVVDDWQDGEDGDSGEDDESRASSDENEESSDQSVPGCQGEGDLRMVLKAFTMLRDQFVEKFRITWA